MIIPEPGEPVPLREFFLEDRRFPAVYFLYHHGEVVYVGQTKTLLFRINQHLEAGVKRFDAVGFIRCRLHELLPFESHHIRQLAPKYNACGLSKKLRERASWSRDQNRAGARRADASDYHVDQAAECGILDDDGNVLIRPKELGKFLMISDKDAARFYTGAEPIPLMQVLYMLALSPEIREAQREFEALT